MNEKYPHLLETTTTECTQRTYMIHPKFSFSDLTEEEKEIAYQSAVHWSEINKNLFDELYDTVVEEFNTLKEKGLASEEGKAIIERWTR